MGDRAVAAAASIAARRADAAATAANDAVRRFNSSMDRASSNLNSQVGQVRGTATSAMEAAHSATGVANSAVSQAREARAESQRAARASTDALNASRTAQRAAEVASKQAEQALQRGEGIPALRNTTSTLQGSLSELRAQVVALERQSKEVAAKVEASSEHPAARARAGEEQSREAVQALHAALQGLTERLNATQKQVNALQAAPDKAHASSAADERRVKSVEDTLKVHSVTIERLRSAMQASQSAMSDFMSDKKGASQPDTTAAIMESVRTMAQRLQEVEGVAADAVRGQKSAADALGQLRAQVPTLARAAQPASTAVHASGALASTAKVTHPDSTAALLGDNAVLPGRHTVLTHAGTSGAPAVMPPLPGSPDGLRRVVITRNAATTHAVEWAFVDASGGAVPPVKVVDTASGAAVPVGTPGARVVQSDAGQFRAQVHLPHMLRVEGVPSRNMRADVSMRGTLHVTTMTLDRAGLPEYNCFSVGASSMTLHGDLSHTDTAPHPEIQVLTKKGKPKGKPVVGRNTVKFLAPGGVHPDGAAASAVSAGRGFLGLPAPCTTFRVSPSDDVQHRFLMLDTHLRVDPSKAEAVGAADESNLRPAPEGVVLGGQMSATVTRPFNRPPVVHEPTSSSPMCVVHQDTFPRRLGVTAGAEVGRHSGSITLRLTADAPSLDEDAGQPAVVGITGTLCVDVATFAVAPPSASVLPAGAEPSSDMVPPEEHVSEDGEEFTVAQTHRVMALDAGTAEGRRDLSITVMSGARPLPCLDTNSWLYDSSLRGALGADGSAARTAWAVLLNDPTPPDAAGDHSGDERNVRVQDVSAVGVLMRVLPTPSGCASQLPQLQFSTVPKAYYSAFQQEAPQDTPEALAVQAVEDAVDSRRGSGAGEGVNDAAAAMGLSLFEEEDDAAADAHAVILARPELSAKDAGLLVDAAPVTRPQLVFMYVTDDGRDLDDWSTAFPHLLKRVPAHADIALVNARSSAGLTAPHEAGSLRGDEILSSVALVAPPGGSASIDSQLATEDASMQREKGACAFQLLGCGTHFHNGGVSQVTTFATTYA